ncbi:hypothetical protein L1987_46249 [Smallanthus sonchifolius]|uniref:Uncharacterized protein n=1 Tax=Smallanthus sonchifolius TaxID=185202 RepID=A0ACB9FZ91_9ASTR|nr:hypothetical protein L1987_46249 [Smallanthus sonchifolius]
MSDNIPLEIQVEIIKRLPVQSLMQFRSVSKTWKSFIDSSHFIAHYSPQPQHLLVTYEDPVDHKQKYVSIADYDNQKLFLTIPLLVNMLMCCSIIGFSHGLFCLYGIFPKGNGGPISRIHMAVIWNLSIRKAVPVVVPNVAFGMYETVIGFGVCGATSDPKIVKVTYIKRRSRLEGIPWQVEVFTLSTRVWRSSYGSNLSCKSIQFDSLQVALDGFLYWIADDMIAMDSGFRSYNLIISFDITSEQFSQVNLPDTLAHHRSHYNLSLSKLRESLGVLERGVEANNVVFSVWMMEHGVLKSFTKLYTFNVSALDASVRGFRNSGELLIEISEEDDLGSYKLVVYDPYSKCIDTLGIDRINCSYYVYPYMETLLLLDQPNLTVYNEMETIKFVDDLVS